MYVCMYKGSIVSILSLLRAFYYYSSSNSNRNVCIVPEYELFFVIMYVCMYVCMYVLY